ncbi:heterokaryon incompatibility protein-domain-containing protein [Podospora aff. communis PSN243]|uniref:Heterokaryon incompatibility protein-domain-containing protein n=1 Tax=Podospora aff. communis PSN243 TaxID=3040156 RepID=A0AAV9GI80_9PEZI|nr:heterokaryon incompatibility protein-domain-containing protein [Podospora aff. communis PSN243]
MDPTPNLCDRCQALELNDDKLGGFVRMSSSGDPVLVFDHIHTRRHLPIEWELDDHLPDLINLKALAESGCDFCAFLRDAIIQADISQHEGETGVRINLWYLWGDNRTGLVESTRQDGLQALVANVQTGSKTPTKIYFGIGSDDEQLAQWLRTDGLPKPTVLCQDNIDFMQNAINLCCTSHGCSMQHESAFLPTRLLDVGVTPQDTPALVITATCRETITKYATLSYCWGPEEDAKLQLQTTVSTLEDRLIGIPVNTMSPVMRDAVDVCRALSIRHLWIDSICIIQDQDGDAVDWDHESQLMGKIFLNSHVTICAVSSASCQQGFLNRVLRRLPIPYKSRVNPHIAGTYWIGSSHQSPDPFENDVFDSPWSRRGWVFQEQKLSSRILFFGERMIHFRCSNVTQSENGFGESYFGYEHLPGRLEHLRTGKWNPADDGPDPLAFFRGWMGVYAESRLKFKSDRLPAVAGLAQLQLEHLRPGDEYLAGIWKSELSSALLWSPCLPQQDFREVVSARQPSSAKIAPSWSWACQDKYYEEDVGSFYLRRDLHLRPDYQALSVHMEPAGSSAFGRILSGSLTLRPRCSEYPQIYASQNLPPFTELMFNAGRSVWSRPILPIAKSTG